MLNNVLIHTIYTYIYIYKIYKVHIGDVQRRHLKKIKRESVLLSTCGKLCSKNLYGTFKRKEKKKRFGSRISATTIIPDLTFRGMIKY